jgi:capsular polysaccharide biosynthesis protein
MNGDTVERILAQHGFEAVEPQHLGFAEQVALFAAAEAVVAPTGAACANLVFCGPGTKAAVLMARHPDMPYRYWAAMAGPLDVEVSCVLGEAWPSAQLGIHSDFVVQERDVLAFLDQAGLQ